MIEYVQEYAAGVGARVPPELLDGFLGALRLTTEWPRVLDEMLVDLGMATRDVIAAREAKQKGVQQKRLRELGLIQPSESPSRALKKLGYPTGE